MGDRVARWLGENRRFLAVVAGGALLLWIFHWIFVSGPQAQCARQVRDYRSSVKDLNSAYAEPDKPTAKRREDVARQHEEATQAFADAVARYGAAPAGAFVVPSDRTGTERVNYYQSQREAVLAEIQRAKSEQAVDIRSEGLGMPDQSPGEANVDAWLWHLQVVRRAVLGAVAARVDAVRSVAVASDRPRQRREEAGTKAGAPLACQLAGTPIQVEVEGSAAACAGWLEGLQRDDGFLVLVEARVRRDEKAAGGVVATATVMGLAWQPPHEMGEAEGRK